MRRLFACFGGGLATRPFLRHRSLLATVACFICFGWIAAPRGLAVPIGEKPPEDAPLIPPATQPEAEPAHVRRFEDVRIDLDQQGRELAGVLPGLDALFDESKRVAAAPKALPVMRKMAALLDEAMSMAPQAGQLRRARMELAAMMSLLGDADGTLQLRKQAVSTDQEEAASATAWEYLVTFAHAGKDAEGEKKAISDLNGLARGNPSNDMIAQSAYLMTQQAANPEVASLAEKIITSVLKSPMAERMTTELAQERTLHALENQPLVIADRMVDGGRFSSSDWKGKVVLVDFWATWCVPCMHEFPHIKKVYDTYHDKGLEIVGVSCDTDGDDLKTFLKANPGLSWPELFDPKAAAQSAFHPLAVQFGVHSIPTLFLIDRKGIVRTVDARVNLDTLLPKLLAEKGE
jgi:thiol-disulfide isomerase/thioredoxin